MVEEIVQVVVWSDSAKISFQKIIDYLQKTWTEREIERFVQRTTEMIDTLKKYPEMCRPSTKRKNVRIGILSKQTQLIYSYTPRQKKIEILLFWNPKQHPSKLKY